MTKYVWLDSDGETAFSDAGDIVIYDTTASDPLKPPKVPIPSFAIQDYYDGLLTPCSDCFYSAFPAWDGTFTNFYPQLIDGFYHSTWLACTYGFYSISGRTFAWATSSIQRKDPVTNESPWVLTVACAEGAWGAGPQIMWRGERSGTTRPGEYTRVAGCSATPETLTLIEDSS